MNSLITRLEKIADECDVNKKTSQPHIQKSKSDSEKEAIKGEIRKIIENLDERDRLMKADKQKNREAIAILSGKIRQSIREVRGQVSVLEKSEKSEINKELLNAINLHIQECDRREKARYLGIRAFIDKEDPVDANIAKQLPSLDDPSFNELRANGRIIDGKLEQIHQNVRELGHQAMEMGKELDKQEAITQDLQVKADRANDQLETMNARMKRVLTQVRSGDKFIIDFILICLLLGLGAHLYFLLI